MNCMYAEEKNFQACEEIIKILHEKEISISQSYAILDYVKKQNCTGHKSGKDYSFWGRQENRIGE